MVTSDSPWLFAVYTITGPTPVVRPAESTHAKVRGSTQRVTATRCVKLLLTIFRTVPSGSTSRIELARSRARAGAGSAASRVPRASTKWPACPVHFVESPASCSSAITRSRYRKGVGRPINQVPPATCPTNPWTTTVVSWAAASAGGAAIPNATSNRIALIGLSRCATCTSLATPLPADIYTCMATLTIYGRSLTAAERRTILEAARTAGIDIPALCWYPKLPIVGNCRICLVSVEGQPKLLPACATKVAEGMVVTTESHAAVENRKGVLRLLTERYPALNGDPRNEFEGYVVRYGVTPTPVEGRDLPLRSGDERPGDPMIRHDMSTCILCTRCVRACEDIQVVGVLDVGFRGEHAEIIVGADGDPDKAGCTWCGECVRVCPTGAIFEVMPRQRFAPERVRHPDRIVRTVCPYCGVGCQVDLHVADEKVVRVTSPDIELDTPNQGSTCVKGRFGYDFPQHRDRLTKPLIRKGWKLEGDRWVWRGGAGGGRRGGAPRDIYGGGANAKTPNPPPPPPQTGPPP